MAKSKIYRPATGPTKARSGGCVGCGSKSQNNGLPAQAQMQQPRPMVQPRAQSPVAQEAAQNYLQHITDAESVDDIQFRYFRGDVPKLRAYAKLEGLVKNEEITAGIPEREIAERVFKHVQRQEPPAKPKAEKGVKIGDLKVEEVRDGSAEQIAKDVPRKDLVAALKSLAVKYAPASSETTLAGHLIAELNRRYPKA